MIRTSLLLILCFLLSYTSLQAEELYWRGGNGNWNNPANWDKNVVPTADDNVHFDNSSFTANGKTISIDANANCNDLIWTVTNVTPVFSGSRNLTIYGELRVATPYIDFKFSGRTFFKSASDVSLTFNGIHFRNEVIFDGDGSWTFMDSLYMESPSQLVFNKGKIETGGNKLILDKFVSNVITPRELNGNSIIEIRSSTTQSLVLKTDNLIANVGASQFNFTGTNPELLITGDSVVEFGEVHFNNGGIYNNITSVESSVNTLSFLNNGRISGNNNIQNLNLQNGEFLLQTGKIQTINNELYLSGNCAEYSALRSTISGEVAKVTLNGATATVNYSNIVDVELTLQNGGQVQTQNIFVENANGWPENESDGKILYWRGVNNDWFDGNNWWNNPDSPTAENCIPNKKDNVVFDNQSFVNHPEIIIPGNSTAECLNFEILGSTSNTAHFGGSGDLNIYNNFEIYSQVDFDFTGDISFYSDPVENDRDTIATANNQFYCNFVFSGADNWELLDTLKSAADVYLHEGALLIENTGIKTRSFISLSDLSRQLHINQSKVEVSAWRLNGMNLTIPSFNFDMLVSDSIINSNVNLTYPNVIVQGGTNNAIIDNTNSTVQYNSLIIDKSANFRGDASIGTLELRPPYSYELQSGSTLNIQNQIIANGGCQGFININAEMSNQPAFVHMNSGTADLSGLIIQDIHATGNANFNLSNSEVLGNSLGWNLSSAPTGQDLFWAGGSGDWNEAQNWLDSSGNPACVPGPEDNVFFEASSFLNPADTVYIISGNAFCKSMNWEESVSGIVLFGLPENSLQIYGGLNLPVGVKNDFAGDILFMGDENYQVDVASSFNNDIVFNGSGEYQIQSNFKVIGGDISIYRGNVIFNSDTILCSGFYALNDSVKSIDLKSAYLAIDASNKTAFSLNTTNTGFIAGDSHINFTGSDITITVSGTDDISFNDVSVSRISAATTTLDNQVDVGYNKLTILSNAEILGNNTYNDLILGESHNYYWAGGTTQEIYNSLTANGNCNGEILLSSSDDINPVTFYKSSGKVELFYANINAIEATGGAEFIIYTNNKEDNPGWIYEDIEGLDLVWIGNDGIWRDGSNWAYLGSTVPSGCIPGKNDNVYFNENSFNGPSQNVTIAQLPGIECKSMNWTGAQFNPNLQSAVPAATIKVFGDLVLNPNMTISFPGEIILGADTENAVLDGKNVEITGNLIFSDGLNERDLLSSLRVQDTVKLNSGILNFNNHNHTFGSLAARSAIKTTLNLDESVVNILNSGRESFLIQTDSLEIIPGNSQVEFQNQGGLFVNTNNLLSFNDIVFSGTGEGSIISGGREMRFNTAFFKDNGYFDGTNTFDTLRFTVGKRYTLYPEFRLSIIDELFITGVSCDTTELVSDIPNQQAFIRKIGGKVEGSYLRISDVRAIPGAQYLAYNSEITNSPGWTLINDDIEQDILGPQDTIIGCADSIVLSLDISLIPEGSNITWEDGSNLLNRIIRTDGEYSVQIDYPEGCSVNDTMNITFDANGIIIVDSIVGRNLQCFNDDSGSASVYVSNGLPDYNYVWSNGMTGQTISGLSAGTYSVSITDQRGCDAYAEIEISQPDFAIVTTDIKEVTCEGDSDGSIEITVTGGTPPYNYIWNTGDTTDKIENLQSGFYDVEVYDSNNCLIWKEFYFLEEAYFDVAIIDTENPTCNPESLGMAEITGFGGREPYQYYWFHNGSTDSVVGKLESDIFYKFSVTDANGCAKTDSTILFRENTLFASFTVNDALCFGGNEGEVFINLFASKDPLTIEWFDGDTVLNKTGLAAGSYNLRMEDANECVIDTNLVIEQPEEIITFANTSSPVCLGSSEGQIDLDITGGTPPYSVTWNTGEVGQNLTGIRAGTFGYIIEDFNGCIVNEEIALEDGDSICITIFDAITPNGDGKNDIWIIQGMEDFMNASVKVFDRRGVEVFNSDGIYEPWDGKYNGKILPVGTYYYIIKLTENTEAVAGNISIIR